MITFSGILTAGLCLTAIPQAPDTSLFEEPFLVTMHDLPITISGGFAAPAVTDFDGDGLPDLLVGQRAEGQVHVYLNRGTRSGPVIVESFPVQAAGASAFCPPG
jgi:hypothetical protein